MVPTRLPNGYREYHPVAVRKVGQIRELMGLRLSVEQARPFVECLAGFFVGGLSAGSNLAGARYLAARHRELGRTFGADRPFALGLRIVEPAAYGTDFTELVADVTHVAFQPVPQPTQQT